MNSTLLYDVQGLEKIVHETSGAISIVRNISFTVEEGAMLAIVGASGSGKSTLLHILGTLDLPSVGSVLYKGRDIASLTIEELAELRKKEIGFVFQFHHLLPEFTTLENVAMHARIAGYSIKESFEKASSLLDDVGLSSVKESRVNTLSGGERQRASIARAIITDPAVILADEPTGSLDAEAGDHVIELLLSLNAQHGTSLIIVTHNMALSEKMDCSMQLEAGNLAFAKTTLGAIHATS